MGMVHWYTWHYLTSWDSSGESPLRRLVAYDLQVPYAHQAMSSRGGLWKNFHRGHTSTLRWFLLRVTKKSNSWLGPILVIWSLWHAFPMFPYKKIGILWARTGGMVSLGPGHLPLPRSQTSLCRQGQGRAGYGGWWFCLSAKSQVFFKQCHKPAIKPAISLKMVYNGLY